VGLAQRRHLFAESTASGCSGGNNKDDVRAASGDIGKIKAHAQAVSGDIGNIKDRTQAASGDIGNIKT